MNNFHQMSYGKSSVFKRNRSQRSFFQDLSQNENVKLSELEKSPSKNKLTNDFTQSVSLLKKRVLELKCKLSALQSQKTLKEELKQKIRILQEKKSQIENTGVKNLENLMRQLSKLKGETEEEKMLLARQKNLKQQKENDIGKMEELIEAKNEELSEIQSKVSEFKNQKNSLLAEIDSNEKTVFLIGEETTKKNLESLRLERQLQEIEKENKRLLNNSEKIQEIFDSKNDQLELAEENNKELKEKLTEFKSRVSEVEQIRNDLKDEYEQNRINLNELKNQKDGLRKQIRNFEIVNQKKNFDVNEFLEEQQYLTISNK